MTARRSWGFLLPLFIALCAATATVAKLAPVGDAAADPAGSAEQAGSAAELPGRRTADSDTFRLPDGEFETRVYEEPVNYRAGDGKWAPTDQRLEASEGGYANAAGGFDLHLPKAVGSGPVRLTVDGGWVSTQLRGEAASAATVKGGTASYRGTGPAPDVKLTSTPTGVEEALELSGPNAPSTFEYKLRTSSGLHPVAAKSGGVSIENRAGDVVATIPPSTVADGRPEAPREAALSETLSRDGDAWTFALQVHPRWLAAKDRVWPVTVDPGVNAGVEGNQWCRVSYLEENEFDDDLPHEEYSSGGYGECGATKALTVGLRYGTHPWGGDDAERYFEELELSRGLMEFSLGSIPGGAEITSASLNLHAGTVEGSTGLKVAEATSSFGSGTSWPGPSSGSTLAEVVTSEGATGSAEYTFTGLGPTVSAWRAGTKANDGLVVTSRDEGDDTGLEGCGHDGEACPPSHLVTLDPPSAAAAEDRPYLAVVWSEEEPVEPPVEPPAETGEPGPAKQTPVAAYSFDEGSGETVEDVTGDGHTATIHGAEWTEHGKYGGALEFDSEKESYVSIPTDAELDQTEEFTVEAWVRPDEIGDWQTIVTKENSTGPRFGYALWDVSTSAVAALGDDEETELQSEYALIPPRAWTHVALTDDGAHTRIYVNGVLSATGPAVPVSGHGEIRIGGNGFNGEYLDGRIDEMRFYNRTLNAAEVDADMETPLQTPKAGPAAAWSFDEGSGLVAEDATGHGHTSTISGATWARGRYGDSLKFDGKKSCVSAAASPELDFTEEFTLEAWVLPTNGSGYVKPVLVQEDPEPGEAESPFPYLLMAGGENAPEAWIRDGHTYKGISAEEPLPVGTWSHIALTDDGANLRLYVDGKLTQTVSAPITTPAVGPFSIGCFATDGDYFKGRIDEVRAYGRALDDAEVDTDMETPLATAKQTPVAAYSFDEDSGETAEDITGDGHTATVHGAEWTPHGHYGGALEFDSEDEDYVSIPASPELNQTEEFTVEAWVRPTEWENWGSILMKEREASSGPLYSYALYQRSGEQARGYFMEEASILSSDEGAMPLGNWTHIALTDDGAHSRLYVNGELVDTAAAVPVEGNGEIRIGGNEPWGEYFDGRIDEVRLYSRALDGAEVDNDMETPLQTPRTAPVASWSFDAGTGTVAEDASGNEHEGTVEGATWTTGKFGQALSFDGSGQCLSVPADPALELPEELTAEAWIKPEGSGEAETILFKETEGGFFGYSMFVGLQASGRIEGLIGNNEEAEYAPTVTSPHSINRNVWTHVAFTFDGRHERLYVNGELVDTNEAEPAIPNNAPLRVGCASEGEAGFDGKIDEVRLYERALSPGEIGTDMTTPLQTPLVGPVAGYSFDEDEGTTVEDLTGNGNDGTVSGASWVSGKYNFGLGFNGENSCVTVPNSESLQLAEEFTLEAWVKPEGSLSGSPILFKEKKGWSGYSYALGIGFTSTGKPQGFAEGEEITAPGTVETNVWTHIAYTYDGGRMRLFVNGEQVASEYVGAETLESSGALYIGCDAFEESFDGRIDEPRLYDRALNPAEVVAGMGPLPYVKTEEAYGVEEGEAVFTADLNPQGQETYYRFEYGPTDSYGKSEPEVGEPNEQPESGDEKIEVEEIVEGLEPETTYHYRVVATNSRGTVVGRDQTVTTGPAEEAAEAFAAEATQPPSFYGTNWSGSGVTGKKERGIDLTGNSGAKFFRIPIGNSNETAALFLHAAEHHVKLLPDIAGIEGALCGPEEEAGVRIPPLNKGRKYGEHFETYGEHWEKQLEELLERFGPEGAFWKDHKKYAEEGYAPEWWEIWNEPNWGAQGTCEEKIDPGRFGEILEGARHAFNAVNNKREEKAKILLGGVLAVGPGGGEAGSHHTLLGTFIKRVGHFQDYDGVSLHPYAFSGVGGDIPHTEPADVNKVTYKVMKNIRIGRRAMETVRKAYNKEQSKEDKVAEKPIWVTEIGWPVDGHDVFDDHSHRPVSEKMQSSLLKASFDEIKSRAAHFDITKLMYYNITDNTESPKRAKGVSNKAWEETLKLGARKWDRHCGLVEDNGGLGSENDKERPAWTTFVDEINPPE